MPIRWFKPFVDYVTANRTLKADQPDHPGREYSVNGAVTFTLPAPVAGLVGYWFEFFQTTNNALTVSAGAGNAVTFNNAAATSLAAQTNNQQIGARIRATCVQTGATTFKWFLEGSTVGVTYTVA